MTGAGEPLLSLHGVTGGYGETVVLEGIDLALAPGESLAVLGRNGTGKTSLLRLVMGLADLHGGRISLAGTDISRRPVHARNRAGLGFVPQEREIFASLTVQENLAVAGRTGPAAASWTEARVYEMFPRLAERRENRGNQLSGGEQQMLAIGRALMAEPELILLDEPSIGLSPRLTKELFGALAGLRDDTRSILLVEQNAHASLAIADRAYLLENGHIVRGGDAKELRNDPAVQRAYLGLE